jgi:hypothetical protein
LGSQYFWYELKWLSRRKGNYETKPKVLKRLKGNGFAGFWGRPGVGWFGFGDVKDCNPKPILRRSYMHFRALFRRWPPSLSRLADPSWGKALWSDCDSLESVAWRGPEVRDWSLALDMVVDKSFVLLKDRS